MGGDAAKTVVEPDSQQFHATGSCGRARPSVIRPTRQNQPHKNVMSPLRKSCKTPRLMMKVPACRLAMLGFALVALGACGPKKPPPAKPVAVSARPFDRGPVVSLVEQNETGPSYRVQIAADITRDV